MTKPVDQTRTVNLLDPDFILNVHRMFGRRIGHLMNVVLDVLDIGHIGHVVLDVLDIL